MFLASRQLDPEVDLPGRDRSRMAITHRGYEIRAQLRPVPHLVFAGAALARFAGQGETPGLRLGSGHRARTNPSAAWLAAVRDQILTDPAALSELRLTTNNLITRRGPRLEHERPASSGARPQRVSVRATEATTLVMSLCAAGASASQIPAKIAERWKAPEPVVRAMLTELVRDGFLLTDLLPGDITVDPLGHLLDKLTPGHRLRTPLVRLRRLLADADRYRPGDPVRLDKLRDARNLADQIIFRERPLSADVAADAHVVLPAALAGEAATAAGVLWRVGCGPGPLTRYHERFLERYGAHRYVPLLDVADPAIGLGIDAAPSDRDPADLPDRRTRVLASLLGRAAANGGVEVLLDDAEITKLAEGQPGLSPPRTAEMCVRVITATPEDLAAGRLRLAVCPGGSPDAGTALGRFTGLLPIAGQDCDDAGLVAEVVARPRVAEGMTLAPPTGLAPQRIPVGVPAEPADLPLDDLLLVSDGHRLILWSFRQDRQVIPVLYSRLTSHLLPPLARFLQLVGRTGGRPLHGWSWEPAGGGPFTPRVRYRRTILTPARWVLPPTLTRITHNHATWPDVLKTWQAETVPAPPNLIVVDDGDRCLPLDLDQANDREPLRRYVGRGVAAVTEPPGGPDAIQAVLPGHSGRHLLELVVPLTRREVLPRRHQHAEVRARDTGLYLPGGRWLSLAIRTPACELLLASLAALAGDLAGNYDTWFWLRYHTPERGPHLRARFRGDPATLGSHVLPALSAWGQEMIRQRLSGGFTVEPYDQEIERYGGPAAIGAAEDVFAADSSLALAILASVRNHDQRLIIAALSAAAIARPLTNAYRAALEGRPLERAARRHMLELRPQVRAMRGQLTAGPDRGALPPAWNARHEVLATYRELLGPARRAECASSLIHLHLNRLLGDIRSERLVQALAADLLTTPPRDRTGRPLAARALDLAQGRDEHLRAGAAVSVHPSGATTTGMAHGIAGPLALPATAHAAGWSLTGQRTAIQNAAHWLLRWREQGAPRWAPSVTGEELDNDTAAPSAGRRDAWCYGAPGIGRALILAGSALTDPQLTTAGDAAIASLAEHPAGRWDVKGPSLCHGYAGVLQSAMTSQAGTGNRAATAIAEAFHPRLAFAFRHRHHGVPSDEPGLLTGAAGVALALALALADHGQLPAPPVPTRWDSLLLLS